MLAEALRNNPDIRVAAAKLAEAEVELNRTRLQVMQKIVALHAAIASKKTEIAYQQKSGLVKMPCRSSRRPARANHCRRLPPVPALLHFAERQTRL